MKWRPIRVAYLQLTVIFGINTGRIVRRLRQRKKKRVMRMAAISLFSAYTLSEHGNVVGILWGIKPSGGLPPQLA